MKSSLGAVLATAMLSCGCAGAGGTFSGGGPLPAITPLPNPSAAPSVKPSASQRATIQAVLVGLQYATFEVGGYNATALSTRRVTSGVRTARDVGCTSGFTQKDTATGPNVTHRVTSLYYDAQCAVVREVATLDTSFGIDVSNASGSAVAYDRSGAVVSYQTIRRS